MFNIYQGRILVKIDIPIIIIIIIIIFRQNEFLSTVSMKHQGTRTQTEESGPAWLGISVWTSMDKLLKPLELTEPQVLTPVLRSALCLVPLSNVML